MVSVEIDFVICFEVLIFISEVDFDEVGQKLVFGDIF